MSTGLFGFFKNSTGDSGSKEKQETKKQEGTTLVVKAARCPQNHHCPSVKVCPTGALSQSGIKAPTVDMDKCIRCGKCVKFCPKRALVLE